jgi:hypothetical protein
MDDRTFDGDRLTVEMAGRLNMIIVLSGEKKPKRGRGPQNDDECFKCGRKGHW